MKSTYLDERLIAYSDAGIYPFHMPGHKRQISGFIDPYRMDITEIDGFDNLHRAEGILKEAQQRAADLYGSKRCYYLVNGSTCGILAAVCAAAGRGGRILMARNCHKAVYHAVQIGGIEAEYLYPVITANDLQGQITPRQVEAALGQEEPPRLGSGMPGGCQETPGAAAGVADLRQRAGYQAVVITSPTYEGVISDVAGIAAVCHAHGIPLIVDSAHGAHLGLAHAQAVPSSCFADSAHGVHPGLAHAQAVLSSRCEDDVHGVHPGTGQGSPGSGGFPEHAVSAGADAVIMSLHKTLPAPTQTALLHLTSDRIGADRVERYLDIFETSSPSYILMAGMDACVRRIRNEGRELFARCRELLDGFYRSMRGLRRLHVMQAEDLTPEEAYSWDDSKLVIFSGGQGRELYRILLERYRLQMEMASGTYVLGMTSVMDTEEGFARLRDALYEIDRKADRDGPPSHRNFISQMYAPNEIRLPLWRAADLPAGECPFAEAAGKVCGELIALYPPGIPLIVPGEVISREFLERITVCIRMGLHMESQSDLAAGRIRIVYF